VDNLSNKPVTNGAINLIVAKGGLLSATTDDKGLFRFTNLLFQDTAHFVLNALNSAGKNTTKITWFNDNKDAPIVKDKPLTGFRPSNDTAMAVYVANDKTEQQQVATYVNRNVILLKQVNIHDKKPDNEYHTQSLAGPGQADQVMHADEIEQIGGQLETSLNGRLRGVKFSREGFPYLVAPPGQGPMLVVLDGTEYNSYNINEIPSSLVETVEVLKYASTSMYGVEGGGGVLIITTKQTDQLNPKDIASIGVLPITVMGFYKARRFYSPKYDNPALVTKQRDLRSTIYWQPEIKTDKDGNAGFEYYNADGTGTYKITIEGIDKDGNIGRQVYRYAVK